MKIKLEERLELSDPLKLQKEQLTADCNRISSEINILEAEKRTIEQTVADDRRLMASLDTRIRQEMEKLSADLR